jgi:hypothetical protein
MALTQVDQGLLGTYAQYTGFKNRLINSAMVIDQRNAGASVSTSGNTFPVDRFKLQSGTSVSTMGRSTTAPSGFINSILYTVGTGASPAAGAANRIYQQIEGLNCFDLAWGTSDAQAVTLSFWVRASVTGTYAVGFYGAGATVYSYITTYTISSANTWTYITLTIPGPTVGTWPTDNSASINVNWDLGTGSTFQSTAGSWTAGTFWATSGSTKIVQTTGATFYLTGVQLEKGSTATSFDYRPYSAELAMCQRYYQVAGDANNRIPAFCGNSTNVFSQNLLVCPMRAQPSLTLTGAMDFDEYYVSGRTQSSSSVSRNSGGTNFVIATFGNFTGLTRGNPGGFYSATYVLQISAEL